MLLASREKYMQKIYKVLPHRTSHWNLLVWVPVDCSSDLPFWVSATLFSTFWSYIVISGSTSSFVTCLVYSIPHLVKVHRWFNWHPSCLQSHIFFFWLVVEPTPLKKKYARQNGFIFPNKGVNIWVATTWDFLCFLTEQNPKHLQVQPVNPPHRDLPAFSQQAERRSFKLLGMDPRRPAARNRPESIHSTTPIGILAHRNW